jgi:hypothetical protein
MNRLARREFLNGVAVPAALGLSLGLGACVVYPDRPPPYVDYPNYYYDYYYYPHLDVYFHIFSGDYYYRRDGRWLRTRVLPRGIWLDRRRRIPLHIKKKRPYEHHREHRSKYAKPEEWRRDKDRSRREREDEDRWERQHNFDRHGEYDRRRRRR